MKILGLGRTALSSSLPTIDFLRRLRAILRRLRPEVVHSNGLNTHLLARAVVPSGVPVSWHVHDFYSERPLMAQLLKYVQNGVAGAVAITEAVKRDFESVVPSVPVTVVLNAVDTDHFSPAECSGSELDRLAGLPPTNSVRVGLVATYANWKGQGVFLEALAMLPPGLVRGYLVGGPIYTTAGSQCSRAELETKADQLGLTRRIGFVPFQPDPKDVYRNLDVVVHASTRPEPFGLTIAEAMSCGRAVVVSAAGGAAELFTDGIDALGHPPGDVSALAAVLTKLATDADLRRRLGFAARKTAVQRFAAGRFAGEFSEFLGRIVAETPHSSRSAAAVASIAE
ncbi:MAG: glycosyltransferase family 4 protein [Fimbriiglobus sp.]|nr:glycosyltransferase family 4 protein [Fimbriiglobus sp.]